MAKKPLNNLNAQLQVAFKRNIFSPKPSSVISSFDSTEKTGQRSQGVDPLITVQASNTGSSLPTPPVTDVNEEVLELKSDSSLDDILFISQSPIQVSKAPPNKLKSVSSTEQTPPVVENIRTSINFVGTASPVSKQGPLSEAASHQHEIAPSTPTKKSQTSRQIHMIDSSPAAPQQFSGHMKVTPDNVCNSVASFRLSQAPESANTDLPKPEIGSLFTEKIALLEQLVSKLKYELIRNGIKWNADDISAKIRDVDHRIDNFDATSDPIGYGDGNDNIGEDVVELYSSPQPRKLTNESVFQNFEDDSCMDFAEDADFGDSAEAMSNNTDQRSHDKGNHAYDSDLEEVGFSTSQYPSNAAGPANAFQVDITGYSDYEFGAEVDDLPKTATSPYFDSSNDLSSARSALRSVPLAEAISQPTHTPQQQPQQQIQSQHHQYPWTKEVTNILKTKFGLQGFRPNQAEAVNETLSGKDVAVLMPTGGGKSLCYQLPALVTSGRTHGTTVVISPLISLMEDQVYHLRNRNIRADTISSKLSAADRSQVLSALKNAELQLLYVSPEMLSASAAMRTALERLHSNNKLARIVIDEAHCVSSWGHDFRPDYLELTKVRTNFPGVPIMALTATANERVLLDIVGCLRPNPLVLKQSFNRRNLFYEVRPKTGNVINEISGICQQFRGRSGIVYCNSKRDCEDLSSKLIRAGVISDFYHAGMDQDRRSQVQSDWQQGQCQVVCATIAFGMGIDKPDVRFVIHMTLPRNIEGYYQETGRAGRDGKPSMCVLFYSFRDVSMLQKMIQTDSNLNYAHKEHHRTLLNRVMQFCENKTDCRRKQVLQYFNESFNPVNCRLQCDNCRAMRDQTVVSHNMTADAKVVINAMTQLAALQITTQQCIDVMLGRRTTKVKTCKFDSLAEFGKLNSLGPMSVERLVHTLISEGILEEYSQFNHSRYPQTYLKLGSYASKVTSNQMEVVLKMSSSEVTATSSTGTKRVRASFQNSRGNSKRRR